jgi:hypothetical protein
MMRFVLLLGLVVALVVGWLFLTFMRGPDLSMYEYLKNPRITTIEDQKMLVVEVVGDPNVVGERAFSKLFEIYYRLKDVPKGPKQPAPRARWAQSIETPREEWIGRYALPVPDMVETLPDYEPEAGLQVQLQVWEYGEAAEILHIGPYSEEELTIEKLKKFIEDQGYEIIGDHEEEYLRGPGMFFTVDPEEYYTIIRYQVRMK